MAFLVFCLQVRDALGYMVFVSHLSHSNACYAALPHLDFDLSASVPVCCPIPCFDTELIGPPSMSLALIYIFFITHF